jgi:thiosulfate/3-mercaptopyruvate sulfurtransferase
MRLVLALCLAAASGAVAASQPSGADLIAPAAVAARLSGHASARPSILYVGFGILYRSKHMPGAVFAGPAAKPEGMDALKHAAAGLPRDRELIVYCGCCPWDHCPNVRPALDALRAMGFKQVKVVEFPTSFLKDWIEKGYPVEAGQP